MSGIADEGAAGRDAAYNARAAQATAGGEARAAKETTAARDAAAAQATAAGDAAHNAAAAQATAAGDAAHNARARTANGDARAAQATTAGGEARDAAAAPATTGGRAARNARAAADGADQHAQPDASNHRIAGSRVDGPSKLRNTVLSANATTGGPPAADRRSGTLKSIASKPGSAVAGRAPEPPRTVLITGGRAPVALDLCRAFASSGHRVIVAESVDAHLCRTSRAVALAAWVPSPREEPDAFIAALAALIDAHGVDLLVPTCEEVFWVARGAHALRPRCRVLVGDPERLLQVHDKGRFIELVASLGLPTPATTRLHDAAEAWAWAREAPAPLVLKPCFSRFGTDVLILGDADRERLRPDRGLLDIGPERPWVGQEFIAGEQVATWGLADRGRLVAHAAYPMGWTAGRACVLFEADPRPEILAFVQDFVQATGFDGQLGFDLVVRPSGEIVPLECNPRATSGLHLLEPAELVRAMLDPGSVDALLTPPPGRTRALTIPLLLQGRRPGHGLGAWARAVLTTPDLVFSWQDPRPALDAIAVILGFRRIGRARGIGLVEATTADIAWDGERA